MIDKIPSMKKVELKQNNNHAQKVMFTQGKDEFVKSKDMNEKLIKSDEHMADVLSENNFETLMQQLITKDFFYNGYDSIRLFIDNENDSSATIGIKNYKTDITEQYNYQIDDFIKLLDRILIIASDKFPGNKEEYNKKYLLLTEKIRKSTKDA